MSDTSTKETKKSALDKKVEEIRKQRAAAEEARIRAEAEERLRKQEHKKQLERDRALTDEERRAMREKRLQARRDAVAAVDEWVREQLEAGPIPWPQLKEAMRVSEHPYGGPSELSCLSACGRLGIVTVYSAHAQGGHAALPGTYGLDWTTDERDATPEGEQKRRERAKYSGETASAFLARVLKGGPLEYGRLRRLADDYGHDYMGDALQEAFRKAGYVHRRRQSDNTMFVGSPEQLAGDGWLDS